MDSNITAHMMVKNEGRWCWFALRSVIDYVDTVIIYDTGSNDKTVECIEWFLNEQKYKDKIIFQKVGSVSSAEIKTIRQAMIDQTKTKWFMILDGDEIWFDSAIKELIFSIKNNDVSMVATRFINCVGNVFSRQNNSRDSYRIKGEVGSITIKAFSKNIPGIHCDGDYGVEGFFDGDGIEVQKRENEIYVQDGYFLHTSYTMRASNIWGDFCIPYRIKKIVSSFDYVVTAEQKNFPEVFYMERPCFVPDPFKRNISYLLIKKIPQLLNTIRRLLRNV